jgi:hypothetical protein
MEGILIDTWSAELQLLSHCVTNTASRPNSDCSTDAKANCFLLDKDYNEPDVENILDLVDLKFLHHVRSRVAVRDRINRLYDACMLDLSQYTGERARRNFAIVEFLGQNADDALRKSRFIFAERTKP